MVKIAINGFGRIGRSVFRRILDNHPDLEVVAINDLTDSKTLSHLLKYDSIYGIYKKDIETKVNFFAEKDPSKLPWKNLGIDIVLECTGRFTDFEGAKKHITAGAKKVIISAPSEEAPMFVPGVNEEKYEPKKQNIISMASCTTNCLAPIVKVINDNFRIIKGFMTTVHAYTNDQRILDLPHKDLRRARAAGLNIIPTTTGATKVIGRIIPELDGKLNGIALRVPISAVSLVDLICELEKKVTAKDINNAFKKASESNKSKGILATEEIPLVSTDYIGNSFSAIIDTSLTIANDNLVKIVAWYDNEWAYACRLAEFAEFVGKKI